MDDADAGAMGHGGITIADMTRILALIDACYEASGNSSGWHGVLDRLGEMFEAPMRHVLLIDPVSRQIRRTLSSTVERNLQQLWLETLTLTQGEAGAPLLPVPHQRKTDRVDPLQVLECRKSARRSYDVLAQQGIQCGLALTVAIDPTCLGVVGVMRSPTEPPFDQRDLDRMKIVLPHLNRAVAQFVRSERDGRQRHAAFAALDRVAPALALLEGNGLVLYCNEKMRTLGRDGDLSIQNGRVHAALPHNRARILAAVEECYRAALSGEARTSRSFALSRASERSPLVIVVRAVRTDPAGDPARPPLVVLLASDPDARFALQRDALSELYGMTGAEADVAAMLAEGLSPDEIAQGLGISMNTVRTHMKRAFEKTRVGRQADLVRVLLSTPVPTLSSAEPDEGPARPGCRSQIP